jgi:PAS domain S-box-containing protein
MVPSYVNAQGERMLQRSRADLLGDRGLGCFPRSAGTAFERECRRAVRTRSCAVGDISSTAQWVVRSPRLPFAQGLAVYFRDVSDQRRAREDLRSVANVPAAREGDNDAIWDWNIGDGSIWWNEGLEALFGYQLEEMAHGRESWQSRVHPEDLPGIADDLTQIIEQGQTTFSEEYRFQRKDGSYAHVSTADTSSEIRQDARCG